MASAIRRLWASLRDGSWLTSERLRVYPALLLVVQTLAVAALFATSDGRHDWFGRPLGTDFAQVWIAGTEVLAGHPEQPYDIAAHLVGQRAFFGPATDVYGWHYPPYFLAPAAVLALLPYAAALAVWQLSTLGFYAAAIRGALRESGFANRDMLVAVLAFPAVFINLIHGQNGFLTAGLFAAALLCLEERPWLAGALFATLAYKPQFGLVIPIALLAGRHWQALYAGAVTLAGMTALSLTAFGLKTWEAFGQSLGFTRLVVLEQGDIGWEKIQSVFAAVRMLGGSVSEAYAMQGITIALCLTGVAWLWRSQADARLRYAGLLIAALLTTPYCLDYDLVLLGPALAFLVAHGIRNGFAPFEKTLLAFVWVIPLFARLTATLSYIPLGSIAMVTLFALVIVRAMQEDTYARRVFPSARRLPI
jgi:alpha-1,2-mannosyltransferase